MKEKVNNLSHMIANIKGAHQDKELSKKETIKAGDDEKRRMKELLGKARGA